MRGMFVFCGILFVAGSLSAQDALPPEKLSLIKRAVVLVKTENGEVACTGSGFLIRVDGTTGYLATNNHVIDLRTNKSPGQNSRSEAVEVVFDSGQVGERVVKAEVIAADVERDLAILRVMNVPALPKPIPLDKPPSLTETMPILACGFPFGGSLATSRKHPGVTISSSRISSVRTNDAGQVSDVQLDGSALNPGNSGGPILTMQGQLVGVAVAGIPGSGIGFAVPNQQLHNLLKGRTGKPAVYASPVDASTLQLRIEGPLLDPFKKIMGVNVYYRLAASGERPPHPDSRGLWAALAKASTEAGIRDSWASATLRIPRGKAVAVWVQFEYRTAEGLTREEPLELKLPDFTAGSKDGRYLTGVRHQPREARGSGPMGTIALKDLNRSPERSLGQTITVDGVLTKTTDAGDGRSQLSIGFDASAKPTNVNFLASNTLTDQMRDAVAAGAKSVRVVGSVLAPTGTNSAYVVEVDEVSVLGEDGTITASYKPLNSRVEKTAIAPQAVSTPTPPAQEKPVDEADSDDRASFGTRVAVKIAVIAGLAFAGFLWRYMRGKSNVVETPPPAPTRTVSERLNRRVR